MDVKNIDLDLSHLPEALGVLSSLTYYGVGGNPRTAALIFVSVTVAVSLLSWTAAPWVILK